jgi:hypothetical protein
MHLNSVYLGEKQLTPSAPLILVVCAIDSCPVMLVVTYSLCSCTTAALALVPIAPPSVPIYLSPLTASPPHAQTLYKR